MHIRGNINGQCLIQYESVQMSTFSADMACFGYEMHIFFLHFFCTSHLCALQPSASLASPLLRLWPIILTLKTTCLCNMTLSFMSSARNFCHFRLKTRLALSHVHPPYQVNQYLGLRRNNHPITYIASHFNFNSETNR